MAALTPKGFEWFVGQAIPLPPSMRTLRTAQEASGHAGEPDTYATSWIAKEVAPAASAGWVNGTPYERKFDRHNPDRTASSYSPDLPWDEWLERPAAEFIDIDRKETFALGPIAHDFPTAQIEVAPLVGGAGWVYGAGYSAAGMGHHERLDRVHNTQEAFDDRETAIAAGVDLIRDSLGSAVRNKLPARIYDWTVAMLSPTTRPVAGSLIDHDDEQPDLIPLTADDLAEMERRRALDAEREIDERAVDWFSGLMKDKLAAAREKGRAGWHDDNACLIDDLAESLIDHIEQGDPTDIANFAMFVLKRAGQDGAREAISQAFEATVKAA